MAADRIDRNHAAIAAHLAEVLAAQSVAGYYGTGLTVTIVNITTTLSRGDVYRVLNTGTDATGHFAITIEGRINPGADVTV